MGKIKQTYIKNICRDIYNEYKDDVSKDFHSNVELVTRITDTESKRTRNIIAGYLVVLKGKGGRMIFSPHKTKKMTRKRRRRLKKNKKKRNKR